MALVGRWQPVAVVALVVLSFVGGRISGHDVQKLEKAKSAEVSHAKAEAEAEAKAAVNIAQVIPSEERTRWRIKYRPAPNGGCEVEEASGEGLKVGPGSIAISSTQESKASSSRSADHSLLRETLTLTEPAPRWHVAALAGVDLKRETHAMVTASYRVAGPWTVSAAATAPVESPRDAAVFVGLGVMF